MAIRMQSRPSSGRSRPGDTVPFDVMLACTGKHASWLASVTFGGPDLSTVYLGSLRATTIPTFPSPVAGLPMVHW